MRLEIFDKPFVGSLERQLEQAIEAFKTKIIEEGLRVENLIRLSAFIKIASEEEFADAKQSFESLAVELFKGHIPAFTIIAQAPVSGNTVLLEGLILEKEKVKIQRKKISGHQYVVVQYPEYKEVYSGGISSLETDDFTLACQKAFDFAEQLLAKEDLHFGHVIRQWNFIPSILKVSKYGKENRQNYQIFNDVRSFYYDPALFVNGYPAATGIGCSFGRVTLDFLALELTDSSSVVPVKSPLQNNAYQYSEKVLVGDSQSDQHLKQAPIFERGKLFLSTEKKRLIVSGTAAIEGETTVSVNDVVGQTMHTIDAIFALCSPSNLSNDVKLKEQAIHFETVRVYLKNEKDYEVVEPIILSRMKAKNILYLKADICRANLLIEIETDLYFS